MTYPRTWLVLVAPLMGMLAGCGTGNAQDETVLPGGPDATAVETGADGPSVAEGGDALPSDAADSDADATAAESGSDAGPEADASVGETGADALQDAPVAEDAEVGTAGEDADAAEAQPTNDGSTDEDGQAPSPEVCNGLDDNGDGLKDEGFECVGGTTGSCQTSCNTEGVLTCVFPACTWSACASPAELCNNGQDDDCDGEWDCKDPDCASAANCLCDPPALDSDCFHVGEFSCSPAVRCNCNFKWDDASLPHYACINVETCNGLDDNGNGLSDETFPCVQNTATSCTASCGTVGSLTCTAACQLGSCIPPAEKCNNLVDDDCDGSPDCADADCAALISCQPEQCDGVDNNGNGLKDEAFQCVYGSALPCTTACGSVGHMLCSAPACSWSACAAPAESCANSVDDNCDGKIDCADSSCASASNCVCNPPQIGWDCLKAGEYSCSPAVRCNCNFKWDDASLPHYACVSVETCNGLDDNGNGVADETFACVRGATSACTTSCGSVGTSLCANDCTKGPCAIALTEVCDNLLDDDCDGKTDCQEVECATAYHCAANEWCNGLDDNGNGLVDESQPCALGDTQQCTTSCGTPTGQRVCIKNPANNGVCIWDNCVAPPAETNCTDGKDDECDGYADCSDPDCWGSLSCPPHDFGTCAALPTTTRKYVCDPWKEETLPVSGFTWPSSACSNSENDQWLLGGDYVHPMARHFQGSAWVDVPLPVTKYTSNGDGNIACLGTNDVFATFNLTWYGDGVLLRWNGAAFERLAEAALVKKAVWAMWGNTATDVWLFATDTTNSQDLTRQNIMRWNGTGFSTVALPSYAPYFIMPLKMWGTSDHDVYVVGYLADGNGYTDPLMLHFDGSSWARISTPGGGILKDISGASSCDVLAFGYNSSLRGVLMTRDGNGWAVREQTAVTYGYGAAVKSASEYVILARNDAAYYVGTGNGDWSTSWSQLKASSNYGGAAWRAGTSTMLALESRVYRSDCHFLPYCEDGVVNEGETDKDCGGPTCPKCAGCLHCASGADCASGVCTSGSCVPVRTTALSSGRMHTCSIREDQSLWCWGDNFSGQLGAGNITGEACSAGPCSTSPIAASAIGKAKAIATGGYHTCAVKTDGTLWCWGWNTYGQLGDGTHEGESCNGGAACKASPVQVAALGADAKQLSAGNGHTCAIKNDGTLWCWGWATYGQLGDGNTVGDLCVIGQTCKSSPVQVGGLGAGAAQVSAGWYHTCAVKSDGTLWCWGWNTYGQLGDGSNEQKPAPVQVASLGSNVLQVAAGGAHTCALKGDHSLWCWGYNGDGELGDGTTTTSATPKQVTALGTSVASVTAGGSSTCATRLDGTVWCWGWNTFGTLGVGSTPAQSPQPLHVSSLTGPVTAMSSSEDSVCALTNAGGVYCWGDNSWGELGAGKTTGKTCTSDGKDYPCEPTPQLVKGTYCP